MSDSRGPWYLLTGVILGLAFGVFWGWYVAPVHYTDTTPATLKPTYKDEYLTLIALAYAFNHDTARTQARLALLEDPDPAQAAAALAQRANAAGRPAGEVQALGQLAVVAAAPPAGIPTAVPLTVFPTLTPLPSLTPAPSATPAPSVTDAPTTAPTSAPSATATVRLTLPPTAAATPFPTATPTATPGSPFILDSRLLTCASIGGQPTLIIRAFDDRGSGVPGVEIILNWPDNEEHIFTGLKPEFGPGFADFTMTPGTVYTLRLADGSQLIPDITAEQCDPGNGQQIWGTLEITFVQP